MAAADDARECLFGPEPDWIDELTELALLAAVMHRYTVLAARAGRRLSLLLAAKPPALPQPPAEDRLLDVDAVARLLGVSVSWIRHLPRDAIPGRVQKTRKGRVRWSERAVTGWLAGAQRAH